MSETEYKCRQCGTHNESFLTACPSCDGQTYERVLTEHDTEHGVSAEVAKLSRPLNPLAPV